MPPSTPPRYTGGQIAMLVIGIILLLPGVCSLLFMIGMASDVARGDPYVGRSWPVDHLLPHLGRGIALIYVARKRARAAVRPNQARREARRRHERARRIAASRVAAAPRRSGRLPGCAAGG
jgi:hypothetical protein